MAIRTLEQIKREQRAIEDEHFAEVAQDRIDFHDQQFVIRAHEIRAALRAAKAFATNLMSQHIRGLMMIEEEKLWRGLGYSSFAEFLTNDESVQMGRNQFYERRDVLLNASDEVLDIITGKVSARKVKALLTSGVEMSVENGKLSIGGQSVEVSDTRAISSLIEAIHQTLAERDERDKKQAAKIEKLEAANKLGEQEIEQKQREIDELRDGSVPRIQKTLMQLVGAFLTHTEAAGELDGPVAGNRGSDDLQLIVGLYFKLADAYGVAAPAAKPAGGDFIDRALAEMGMDDLD